MAGGQLNRNINIHIYVYKYVYFYMFVEEDFLINVNYGRFKFEVNWMNKTRIN